MFIIGEAQLNVTEEEYQVMNIREMTHWTEALARKRACGLEVESVVRGTGCSDRGHGSCFQHTHSIFAPAPGD